MNRQHIVQKAATFSLKKQQELPPHQLCRLSFISTSFHSLFIIIVDVVIEVMNSFLFIHLSFVSFDCFLFCFLHLISIVSKTLRRG